MTGESNRVSPRSTAIDRTAQARSASRNQRSHPHSHPQSTTGSTHGFDIASATPDAGLTILAPPAVDADPNGGDDQDGQSSSAGSTVDPPQAEALRHLDIRLQRVGVTIATLCRSAQSQTSWHARIPLDPELLAGTVLHLAYSPTMMTVRFETTEWPARELLLPRVPSLEQVLVEMLPSSCQVFVSVT